MALQITTTFQTTSGIELQGAYARVTAVDQAAGTSVLGIAELYLSEQDYLDGKSAIDAVPFQTQAQMKYDREVNGVDILAYAHDALVDFLGQQGIIATIEL